MNSPIFLTRNGDESAFAKPLKRAVLRDKRLSFGARGLFCMLWDFPTNWTFYASHIVLFSPGGVTQLRGYIAELKSYGALKIIIKKINATEANALSTSSGKTYKSGQIIGKQWVLNHPDYWAIEAPLSEKPIDRFSELRFGEDAEKPIDSNTNPRGFEYKGSPNLKVPQLQTEAQTARRNYSFPVQLNPEERRIAESLLLKTNEVTANQILDVLGDKLAKNKIRGAPLGYLNSLVERANRGLFYPEVGMAGAVKRQQQEKTKEIPTKRAAKPDSLAIEAHINKMYKSIGKTRHGNKSNLSNDSEPKNEDE